MAPNSNIEFILVWDIYPELFVCDCINIKYFVYIKHNFPIILTNRKSCKLTHQKNNEELPGDELCSKAITADS